MNAVKASAANAPSATQIANAPEASAAAAGNAAGNAANAAAAANGRADHKPVAVAEESAGVHGGLRIGKEIYRGVPKLTS